ncbi:MAG TPA: DegT/DnrJ/EryC1/StrS aminotransferase family protein [Mycobacteriales bacterium]|nr:DegT/DnrJ/EryC1/StrS aminotransferase family protein [Mycobacteriales bacterium]
MSWRVALSEVVYGDAERAAVERVLASGWVTAGPEVAAFEQELGVATSCAEVAATSSATAALHLALLGLGIGPGDEVVQPALNFVAAANVTALCGAQPVFADICSDDDPTIDPDAVADAITSRTRAVVAMHYGGTAAQTGRLRTVCARAGVTLVEDACHALGATYGGADPELSDRRIGCAGAVAAFSFYGNKNLATGEGGAVTTNDAELAARVRKLRSHGMGVASWDRYRGHASTYDVEAPGLNYRWDDLHAAIGRAQLAALDGRNDARRRILDRYRTHVPADGSWTMPFTQTDRPTAAHLAVAVLPDAATRDRAAAALTEAGVQTSRHYPCIADFTAHRRPDAEVRLSRSFSARALTLPLHPRLQDDVVDGICTVLSDAARSS